MRLNTVEELISDIREGKMIVLMDDEDRENEGDLVMAAAKVRPEDINFMARYARGLICLTLTRTRCQQLNLPLMVGGNDVYQSTNFTLSIEAATGVSTGISAADRARTIQAAVAIDAKPQDLVQPGHVFPVMAQSGGVLNRTGHTEAGCDLAQLAGLEPAAVIVEILNEDGSMARRPDLEQFAQHHQLKIGTIADLVAYRMRHERMVQRVAECDWPTPLGDFTLITYQDQTERCLHYALVKGDLSLDTPALVRVHVMDVLSDLLQGTRQGSHRLRISHAIERIAEEGRGVVLLLTSADAKEATLAELTKFVDADHGHAMLAPNLSGATRTVGIGSQILVDLGVRKLRVLGTQKRYHALSGFGLEVVDYVSE